MKNDSIILIAFGLFLFVLMSIGLSVSFDEETEKIINSFGNTESLKDSIKTLECNLKAYQDSTKFYKEKYKITNKQYFEILGIFDD